MSELPVPDDQDILIIGATGDLARRKLLPALWQLHLRGSLPPRGHIIGFARGGISDEEFRDLARKAILEAGDEIAEEPFREFAAKLRFYPVGEDGFVEARNCCPTEHRLIYLAIPPRAFANTVDLLESSGLVEGTRLVVEKPFGHDLESARALDDTIHRVFAENQVFRIDHYLAKETVQNIAVLRFGNMLFERTWNRDTIESVQLTVAESIGMEGRGSFYEGVGAIRDIIQNHALQVVSLLAMEPPHAFEPEAMRDERSKVSSAIEPVRREDVVIGQYTAGTIAGQPVPGYREEPDVAPDSVTETYAALRLRIDNWRWAGVPFFVRTGKRLRERTTEVTITYRHPPLQLFERAGISSLDPDHLTIGIQPNERVVLTFLAKVPGPRVRVKPVDMSFEYDDSFMREPHEAYERVLHDALHGDPMLFARDDAVLRAWKVLDPVLRDPPPLHFYAAGTWGPEAADNLIAPRRWHLH